MYFAYNQLSWSNLLSFEELVQNMVEMDLKYSNSALSVTMSTAQYMLNQSIAPGMLYA